MVLELWQIIGAVLASAAVGGGVTLAGLGVIARTLRGNPTAIAFFERLVANVDPDARERANRFVNSLDEITELLKEITDNVPAQDKISVVVDAPQAQSVSVSTDKDGLG